MAKRESRPSGKPPKYEPVPVSPIPCTQEELESHLSAFVARFIQQPRQSRWRHSLLERPKKASRHLSRVETDLAEGECVELQGAASFPGSLTDRYGSVPGVYFDGTRVPCKMTAAEAATIATEEFRDAILSLVPGERALVFHHEGRCWACERRNRSF